MPTPELKQDADSSCADFERHPVWIGVHHIDVREPWHSRCDEATCRPWTGSFPASAEIGPVVVTAMFELSDGSLHSGFVCAVKETRDVPPKPNIRGIRARYGGSDLALLGIRRPRIFVNQLRFRFWGGRRGIPLEERRAFYAAFGKTPEEIFPVKFRADPMLVTGSLTGRLDGFYRLIGDQASQAERWGSTNPRSQLINPPISL